MNGLRINTFGLLGHYDSGTENYIPIGESEVSVPGERMAIGDSFYGGISLERQEFAGFDS